MTKLLLNLLTHFLFRKFRFRYLSIILVLLIPFVFATNFIAQKKKVIKTRWLYVGTQSGDGKHYIRNDLEKLKSGHIKGWRRLLYSNYSYGIYLTEWDCTNKKMYNYEATGYNDQGVAIVHQKFEGWDTVVADSIGEKLMNRVCGNEDLNRFAKIKVINANLRSDDNVEASVLRVAKKGEQFRIVFETPNGRWYNIVDQSNQEDYWIHHSTVKVFRKK